MGKVLLISVGGTSEPIVQVLKEEHPEKVIFFTSTESRKEVEESILPSAAYYPMCGFVVTPDVSDVGKCVFELLEKVPEEMRKIGEESQWPELCAYTGGTKAMSSAVVWASSRYPCELIYVGGSKRTKDGLGIVETGTEQIINIQNPWDMIAWHQTELARYFFNQAQYDNASRILDEGIRKVSNTEVRDILSWLKNVSDFFQSWDIFNHKLARKKIGSISIGLKFIPSSVYFPGLKDFRTQVNRCIPFLQEINPSKPGVPMVMDLIANAMRRGRLENKYEDAVARCYSALEKLAKVRLKEAYNIDNSNTTLDMVPDNLKDDFKRYEDESGKLQFGLKASYILLEALGDSMGRTYMREEERLGNLLGSRNSSILGHGFSPVKKEIFENFLSILLSLSGNSESDLVSFPRFNTEINV